MSFLYCDPCVFVIGKEYEILVIAKENGIISIFLDGNTYYEDNSGVLSSEKNFAKIRVPQKALDCAKEYTVCYRKTVKRSGYFSELGEKQELTYSFKLLTKTDDINLYHIADVHYRFDLAKKTATYFGDDLDLLLVNGDIGEVETIQNYLEVASFVADIAKGSLPVVFVRGNHDARGHLAEIFTDYFPANCKNTYFTFDIGPLHGVAFDCGEDKLDSHAEYGNVNVFEPFRRRETAFFKALEPSDKMTFAIGHINPSLIASEAGGVFDIEREVYPEWIAELERINTSFMICGHIHRAFVLKKNDPYCMHPQNYPVIIGSECEKDDIIGTALNIKNGEMTVLFTDKEHSVRKSCVIDLKTGDIKLKSARGSASGGSNA